MAAALAAVVVVLVVVVPVVVVVVGVVVSVFVVHLLLVLVLVVMGVCVGVGVRMRVWTRSGWLCEFVKAGDCETTEKPSETNFASRVDVGVDSLTSRHCAPSRAWPSGAAIATSTYWSTTATSRTLACLR